ncbi:hypothetical protein [Kibdelosporangium phytohabitans]|uniref:Uncharacterized protein n=1 Tax=Kibdelosporangium phytohabitans TaxID=860235 RepID=A0A0N9ICR6_9PSEU|nr:hypothetical protein [Kibdelosporangium phytohabitans]ALG12425.1 hypothetical protein AOZ06_41170 [Kibdelosporangium phytohabitans]MBE1464011.1 hypothetical protein [Kibdelosporangium phytohabitans]
MIVLSRLTRRLAETPNDFTSTAAFAPAVISDVLAAAGRAGLDATTAQPFLDMNPRWRELVLISCWLVADESFRDVTHHEPLVRFLRDDLPKLAELIEPRRFVSDPDRREELARLAMLALAVMPSGETAEQAADRLATVDSVRRYEVLEATKAAEERAAAVRRAMEAERAREAAARYSQV